MKVKLVQKINTLIMCLSIIFSMIGIGIKDTFALESKLDTKVYTRKEMQEMVVSTALSLYYNNYFSDYGQTAMDNVGEKDNYFHYGNYLWRDLNISPESVGYSKYYHIDCSGYNFLIYKNTIGYDMSEYNVVNRYRLFDKERNSPVHRVSFYTGETRLNKFREAYERFGYGWNSGFLANVARKAANNCGDTNCTKLQDSTSTSPFIYNNINGNDKNEVVYYFEARSEVSLATVKAKYAIAEAALQPGDIIAYTKYDASKDETSGHVMFYAGDDIMSSSKNEKGFTDLLLHSTGNGGGDYTSSATSVNNKLYKKTSIIDSSAKDYIDGPDGRFESVYKNSGDYIVRFSVIRPLNTVCESDSICKISNNSFNVKLTDTQLNNNEARVALKKTQVQQYMIVDKEYNNQKVVTSSDQTGKTRNIISEYNSVNIGDRVIFKLRLRNKFDQTEVSGIKVEAIIPDNATYVSGSCSDNCKKEGNKLTWENIGISGENVNNDIYFSVRPKTEGTVVFDGYTVTKDSKTLQLDPRTVTVMPTQNGINKEILRETVDKFQTLVTNGQIGYVSSATHTLNTTNLNDLIKDPSKTIETSTLGYIKLMYYNAFGYDLDEIIGTESILNSTKIKEAIFEEIAYPERNNLASKGEDGLYPLIPEENKTPKVFGKKTATDYETLTNVQKKISQMLVPGLYGGKHLKGNDNYDRTKFLRSFYNNSAYQSDLEVGDIIIYYTSDSSSIRAFLYLGDDGENGAILTRFTISNSDQPLFLYHTDQYLSTYYNETELQKKTKNKPSSQILNELFSKDLFVVLRPSRLGTTVEYDYNGGYQGPKSYVAYTKYHNLVTPKKEMKALTLKNPKAEANATDVVHTGTNSFECWTTDEELKECVTNTTRLDSKDYHKLYAKWNDPIITLPKLTFKGYTHEGWYSDETYKTKIANPNVSYAIAENETLYAKWVANTYTIKFSNNTGTGTMSSITATYDKEVELPEHIYIKNGYTFSGWNTKADGTGTSYTDGSTVMNLAASGTITLYAQWKPNNYTVQFNRNTGTGSMNQQVYTYDTEVQLPTNAFTKEHYKFIGWNTKADGTGTNYDDKATVKNIVTSGTVTLYAQWEADTYIIKFNNNGGTGTMSSQKISYDKSTAIKKNTYTKEGYTFKNWNTSSNGSGTIYTDGQTILNVLSTGTLTLYAQWEANTYSVKFNNNGGTGTMPEQTFKYDQSQTLVANTFIRTGYTFSGWNTESDGTGTTYNNKSSVKNLTTSGTFNLYAIWKANTYTIKFNGNSGTGTMSDQSMTYDQTKTLPANEYTKTGYTFDSWNTKADGSGTKYTDNSSVKNITESGEVTLYAIWKPNDYKIIFNNNTGTGTMNNQVMTYDQEIALTANSFTKEGYTFDSWNTKADGSGTKYADKMIVKNLKSSGNITLYAIWKPNIYTIKFDSNTGTGNMSDQTMTYDQETNLTTNNYTKEGYKFDSWNTKPDGSGTKFVDNSSVKNLTTSTDITLYAIWTANTYKITYNNTTGEGTMSVQTATYDEEITLKSNEFTKEGYTFIGWNTKENGTGITYQDKAKVKNLVPSGNITLYAMWSVNTYTIIFNSNGGEGTMSNLEMTYDEEKTLPPNAFTKENYKFIGWNTKTDGTGKTYNDQEVIKNVISKGNITLYALWKTTLNYNIKDYTVDDVNKYIDSIPVNTTQENYLKNIEVGDDYNVEIDLGNKPAIATGSITKIIKNGKVVIEFKNIIRGEVTGDGVVNYLDYVNIYNHIQKTKNPTSDKKLLTDVYLIAGDMSNDNKIDYLDYVRVYNLIKELKK